VKPVANIFAMQEEGKEGKKKRDLRREKRGESGGGGLRGTHSLWEKKGGGEKRRKTLKGKRTNADFFKSLPTGDRQGKGKGGRTKKDLAAVGASGIRSTEKVERGKREKKHQKIFRRRAKGLWAERRRGATWARSLLFD